MRKFVYTWTDDIFLLHIQLNKTEDVEHTAVLIRQYEGGKEKKEIIQIGKNAKSHRFIVSRTHPKERQFKIEYPEKILLQAFKIDDRAYYPTEAFFAG